MHASLLVLLLLAASVAAAKNTRCRWCNVCGKGTRGTTSGNADLISLSLTYTGINCERTSCNKQPKKAHAITGDAAGRSGIIRLFNGKTNQLIEDFGPVKVGGTITMTTLKRNMVLSVFAADLLTGPPAVSVTFDASCKSTIRYGDSFGPFAALDFKAKHKSFQDICGSMFTSAPRAMAVAPVCGLALAPAANIHTQLQSQGANANAAAVAPAGDRNPASEAGLGVQDCDPSSPPLASSFSQPIPGRISTGLRNKFQLSEAANGMDADACAALCVSTRTCTGFQLSRKGACTLLAAPKLVLDEYTGYTTKKKFATYVRTRVCSSHVGTVISTMAPTQPRTAAPSTTMTTTTTTTTVVTTTATTVATTTTTSSTLDVNTLSPTWSAKSCETLGWRPSYHYFAKTQGKTVCGMTMFGLDNQCHTATSWLDAHQFCDKAEARLCRREELAGDAARSTGCDGDKRYAWAASSSDLKDSTCPGAQGADFWRMVVPGSSKMHEPAPVQCFPAATRYTSDQPHLIRCCADGRPEGAQHRDGSSLTSPDNSGGLDNGGEPEFYDVTTFIGASGQGDAGLDDELSQQVEPSVLERDADVPFRSGVAEAEALEQMDREDDGTGTSGGGLSATLIAIGVVFALVNVVGLVAVVHFVRGRKHATSGPMATMGATATPAVGHQLQRVPTFSSLLDHSATIEGFGEELEWDRGETGGPPFSTPQKSVESSGEAPYDVLNAVETVQSCTEYADSASAYSIDIPARVPSPVYRTPSSFLKLAAANTDTGNDAALYV